MTRISSLLLATGLAIMPVGAFAQQNASPAATPMAQAAPSTAQATKADTKTPSPLAGKTETKTPAAVVKTPVVTKDIKSTHAKLSTPAPATTKTAEPNKS
jgi:hypothetical protein